MIARIWKIIESLFGWKKQERPVTFKKPQKKQRFLVIDDPYEPKPKAEVKAQSTPPQPMPKNAAQLMNFYRITSSFQQTEVFKQQVKQNEDLFLNLKELQNVIDQIEEKQKFVTNSTNEMVASLSDMLTTLEQPLKCEEDQRKSYRKYVDIVEKTLSIKYTWEKVDFPEISFERFKDMCDIWNLTQKQGQNLVQGYEHLRYCHLRLLAPNTWLNDEIISEYINQMNLKLAERQGNNFLIFNSLKVTSLFDKADYKKLQKIFQRQKVTRDTVLLLAIHKKNHWLFVRMQDALISIFDSMNGDNLKFPLISKIIKFANYYYQSEVQVQSITTFPQQNNGNDCGMMMLCGMKDLVRDYTNWSFSQNDILYKRVLFTKELLEKQITGF